MLCDYPFLLGVVLEGLAAGGRPVQGVLGAQGAQGVEVCPQAGADGSRTTIGVLHLVFFLCLVLTPHVQGESELEARKREEGGSTSPSPRRASRPPSWTSSWPSSWPSPPSSGWTQRPPSCCRAKEQASCLRMPRLYGTVPLRILWGGAKLPGSTSWWLLGGWPGRTRWQGWRCRPSLGNYVRICGIRAILIVLLGRSPYSQHRINTILTCYILFVFNYWE